MLSILTVECESEKPVVGLGRVLSLSVIRWGAVVLFLPASYPCFLPRWGHCVCDIGSKIKVTLISGCRAGTRSPSVKVKTMSAT